MLPKMLVKMRKKILNPMMILRMRRVVMYQRCQKLKKLNQLSHHSLRPNKRKPMPLPRKRLKRKKSSRKKCN
tara:strand:- start:556 stop:771 length:216 start_codon:yes stop_codon:yes gene_type:complete